MSDSNLLPDLLFIVNTVLQHGPEYSMNIQGSDQRVTRVTITLESIQPNGMCDCRTVLGNGFQTTMEQFIDLMRTSLQQSADDASAGMPDESAGMPDGSTEVPGVMDRLRL